MSLEVKAMEREFHTPENFREQIFALYFVGMHTDAEQFAKLIRSHVLTCEPGAASCDHENPGADTMRAWQLMDTLIENHGVRGFFHTHPAGIHTHSMIDEKVQIGMARTYGERILWYGVQAVDRKQSYWLSARMLGGSHVIFDDFGFMDDDLRDPVILVPVPQKIEHANGISRIHWD